MPTVQTLRVRFGSKRIGALVAILSASLAAPGGPILWAQEAQEPAAPSAASPAAEAPAEATTLSNDQLDSLVAPIALYPDPLLSQCLVASTYPLDIVEAQQWLTKNSSLKGDELTKAAEKQDWDPSVQAMVAFPDVVKRMSESVKWTTDLGNAFLEQQSDVMDAVQRLRAKAKQAGKLDSSEQQKVETKTVETKTIIEIQPTSTEVIYVPTYSPTVVWGPPPYPYPPMYYPPYYAGAAFVSFGVGIAIGAAIGGGWGWGCGWGSHNTININNNNTFVRNNNVQNNINRSGNSNWQHNAQNRGGVPYKDKATASKYGGGARGDSMQTRQTQARQRDAQSNRGASAGANTRGASAGPSNRGASGGASSMNRGGGSSSASRVGSRDVSPSSRSGSSSAFGGSQSRSRAQASSSRGASSMGSRGGGGRRR